MIKAVRSKEFFEEAKRHLVGGVNSPVRAYRGLDVSPPFIVRGEGSHIWDADGNEYIDYVGSWGPLILGHAYPDVVRVVKDAVERGMSFGAPTEAETELAIIVKEAFPSIDLVRFVSSGTEAAMSAIRVARAYTGRPKIIKFNGCYHGHADSLLVRAGSGAATFSEPDSAGVPEEFARQTLIAEYNDLGSVEDLVDRYHYQVAAIIVEPVAGNMGCVAPEEGFLHGLRDLCNENGIVLIFDEVITGFRIAYGGAQELYGVKPDLTCLGKILGGGLPMGAFGGSRQIMERVSPLGPAYQAGTLSGNPVAVAAGLATIKILRSGLPLPRGEGAGHALSQVEGVRGARRSVYKILNDKTAELTDQISEVLTAKDTPHVLNRVGSMFTVFFTAEPVRNFRDASMADRNAFNRYFTHMLSNGIYLAPSPYECAFVSLAHTDQDIEKTIKTLREF